MISIFARSLVIVFALMLGGLASANAIDWPKEYVVHEKSESPDGEHGIIVPDNEASEGGDNYLANLKKHQVLGKIDDEDYFEHQNHASLNVEWSPDSKWCVATYWGRFGFGSILILEPTGSTFTQTEIGDRVQKSLDAAMKKQSHDKEMSGYAGPNFRFGPGRRLRVRALSQNNPKQLEGVKTYYALFQGVFDLDAKKWSATDARSITSDQNDELDNAYGNVDADLEHTEYPSEQDKFEALDQKMNSVYRAVQFVLPPARFAAVKQEQREWLKKRDAALPIGDKCKMMVARIKALQDLVW